MKKTAVQALVLATTLVFSVPALAHDGWSQTNAPIIAQGEVSYVELLLGNHSNGHKSYRIAGQWSTDSSKVYVTTPAGKKVDITSTRFYTGEAATETEPALNNGFIASFSSAAPGAYIISVEGDSIFKNGDVSIRTLRSAKSFVAVSDIPLPARVEALRGFSRTVHDDRAEWVPQFNPAAVVPNEQVSVQLLLKGEPLADTEVSLIRRSNSEAQTLTTDAQGTVTFQTGSADYYLLRAKPTTDERQDGEYEAVNYEATMTFTVQNGAVSWPASDVDPAPHVFVNGKKLDGGAGAAIKDGTAYVEAAWIREAVDAEFQGDGLVPLRSTAEALGATVEFLPAVGDTRAAVLVYTK